MINENGGVNDTINGGVNGGVKLTDRERTILNFIQNSPSKSISSISEALGIPKRTLERIISNLRQHKIIKRIGSEKTGTWKVNKDAPVILTE